MLQVAAMSLGHCTNHETPTYRQMLMMNGGYSTIEDYLHLVRRRKHHFRKWQSTLRFGVTIRPLGDYAVHSEQTSIKNNRMLPSTKQKLKTSPRGCIGVLLYRCILPIS